MRQGFESPWGYVSPGQMGTRMNKSATFLQFGARVFTVLAWISLSIQGLAGLFVLVLGGDPVLLGGVEVPARLVGVLNVVGGAIYFFILLLVAHVLRVLLMISQRLEKGA